MGDEEEEIMVCLFNETPLTDSLCCFFPLQTHSSDLKIQGLKAQMFSLTHKHGIFPASETALPLVSSEELIWDERS